MIRAMETMEDMIEQQLKARDITDERVLRAMGKVKREFFVPEEVRPRAYKDGPLPIGRDQTISQPYIVAYMAQALDLKPDHTVLEIGTGSGYNAAVMSRIVSHVYSMEIVEWLAHFGLNNLRAAGIENVSTRYGDGYKGWPEKAPFDRIVLTAATPAIPQPLKDQLKTGGLLLAPVGYSREKLILLKKRSPTDFTEAGLIPVRFVPMTGQVQSGY